MKNKFSGKYFQLTVCFSWFDLEMVWSENFHFKSFLDSRVKTKRERERERERKISCLRLRLCIDHIEITPSTSHQLHRDRTPGSNRDGTDCTPWSHRNSTDRTPGSHRSLSFPIWCRRPPLTGFDEFFLVGFCFCVYLLRNCIICLFGSWENVRKMWGTSRKCVFYIIFSNTTKH